MIDWEQPIRRVGHVEELAWRHRTGTDRWVIDPDGGLWNYTQSGAFCGNIGEPRQPRLENIPGVNINKRLCWADTGDRVWFSHHTPDGDPGDFMGSTRDGICYTFNRLGRCLDEGDDDRWLVERDDALAVICREMTSNPMEASPIWGMFG